MFSLMRASCAKAFIVAVALFTTPGEAARDPVRLSADRSVEFVVYEARRSPYSEMFRTTNLLPMLDAARPRDVPVRFVDVLASSSDGAGLSAPIDIVPTVVLFRDGQEQGRIVGLFGPGDFLKLLANLMRGID